MTRDEGVPKISSFYLIGNDLAASDQHIFSGKFRGRFTS